MYPIRIIREKWPMALPPGFLVARYLLIYILLLLSYLLIKLSLSAGKYVGNVTVVYSFRRHKRNGEHPLSEDGCSHYIWWAHEGCVLTLGGFILPTQFS